MNHRDTMYTEKTRNLPTDIGSLIGDCLELTPSPFFSLCSSCLCGPIGICDCIDTAERA